MRSCCPRRRAGEERRAPTEIRQARAQQQETILRAALAEFAAHGFADASLNRIIEAAGISKGSLYYYFDTRRTCTPTLRARLSPG